MPMPNRFVLICCLGIAAPAQTTHLVGPGGYPQIGAAIAAASPGDIILVQPGSYSLFATSKALTIRATVPGAAIVPPGFGGIVLQPPAGQTVHLVGMHLCLTVVGSGRATFDGCRIDSPSSQLAVLNAAAHLQDCVVRSYPPSIPAFHTVPALKGTNAELTVVNSTIEGGDSAPFVNPGVAVELVNSTFRGSQLALRGGNGTPVMPAIQADAASSVWISDSTIDSDAPACPIAAANGRHDRCVLTPNCGSLPAGFVLGIDRPQPIQNGAPFLLHLRASPGSAIGVFVDHALATSLHATLEQSLLLDPTTAFSGGVWIADQNGSAIAAWAVPAGPAFIDLAVWFQAFTGPAFPLQASAIVGGVVR
ncbi:MAG: hypothetical protein WAT39_06025 [Planctomycetota bacterium]